GDGKAAIQLIYFSPRAEWLEKLYPIGAERLVSGPVEWFDMRPQMPHPDYVLPPERAHEMPGLEPVYGLTEGLSTKILTRATGAALAALPDLLEWISPDLIAQHGWPSFAKAVRTLHRPVEAADALPEGPAWSRLAFDELLA